MPKRRSKASKSKGNQDCLLQVQIRRQDERCSFLNKEVIFQFSTQGESVWLKGISGAGKSLIAKEICGFHEMLYSTATVQWNKNIPQNQRVGILFQQGVLIDSLNVEENIALGLKSAGFPFTTATLGKHLANVGLTPADGKKKPSELSGGMLRRACLAQILAQRKRLIILDEPFVGLDTHIVQEIVTLLHQLQKKSKISYLIISHNINYAKMLKPDRCVELFTDPNQLNANLNAYTNDDVDEKKKNEKKNEKKHHQKYNNERDVDNNTASAPRIPRYSLFSRFSIKLIDYLGISAPLIACAFIAAGLAISMMFANLLHRVEIGAFLDNIKELALFRSMIDQLLDRYLPDVKSNLYVLGLARVFVMELGPLLTALLLAGRIGGSYSGEIGTMQSTKQNALLTTLSINPRSWSLIPSLAAALVAAPILCALGTYIALYAGCYIGTSTLHNDSSGDEFPALFEETEDYWEEAYSAIWDWGADSWITYPPSVNAYRSCAYILIVMLVAEVCGRFKVNLDSNQVPKVITWCVVLSSLSIILLDWGFNKLLLMYL